MKLLLKLFVFTTGLLCLNTGNVWAQEISDTTAIYRIVTTDGNEYFGTIEERTATHVRIRTEKLGVLTLQMDDIRVLEEVQKKQIKDGAYWHPNPQATRYFWAPNGYGLPKGQGYYQNVWVLFNQVSYGFTNNFSMGVGIMPLFLFQSEASPVWFTPKISIPVSSDNVNIGAGSLIGTIAGAEFGFFGIAYGVLTFGSRDKNFNVGVGYGFADGGWADTPVITASAMIRMSRRGYFITENHFISAGGDNFLLVSAGGRFVGENISIDFGGFIPAENSDTFILPWLGIVIPLGEK